MSEQNQTITTPKLAEHLSVDVRQMYRIVGREDKKGTFPKNHQFGDKGPRVWGPAEIARFEELMAELNKRPAEGDEAILQARERLHEKFPLIHLSGLANALLDLPELAVLLGLELEMVRKFTKDRSEELYGVRLEPCGKRSYNLMYRLSDVLAFLDKVQDAIQTKRMEQFKRNAVAAVKSILAEQQ